MTRAVGYIRVSTGKQIDGTSLPEQRRGITEYAEREGWTLVHVYADKGISAVKTRPDLDAMLAAAKRNEFDTLIVRDIDRVGRSLIDLSRIVTELHEAGVRIITFTGRTVDVSTPEGEFQFNVLASAAQYERQKIAERVSGTAAAKAADGWFPGGMYPPYGYCREPVPGLKRTRLVVVPEQAAVVRRMFEEANAGRSERQILRDLNRDGLRSQQGCLWEQGTVSRILRAHVYAGRVEIKDEVFPGRHDAVVSPELWEKVAQLRAARDKAPGAGRGRRTAGDHLFTYGLLRCGFCGGPMSPRTYPKGDQVYLCRHRARDGVETCAMPPSVPRPAIDDHALEYFARVGVDMEATRAAYAEHQAARLHELRTLREAAEREHMGSAAKIARVEADYLDGKLDAERWQRLDSQLREGQEAGAAKVAALVEQERAEAEGGALRDAEAEVLRVLADVRASAIAQVRDAQGTPAVRAALLRGFESFTLHHGPVRHAHYRTEADPGGYTVDLPEDGWWLEARPRAKMLRGIPELVPDPARPGALVEVPTMRKVALDLGATKSPTA